MIPTPGTDGLLPLGRFPATLAEVETTYVTDPRWTASTTRSTIWADWQRITAQARNIVPVAAAWFGGSFLTDKMDPDDLDVVYVIDSRSLAGVTKSLHRGFLNLLAQGNAVRSLNGARLDTFVLSWVPNTGTTWTPAGFADYARWRGYWDDLWQRKLGGPKTAPRVPSDALPKCGYLEVTLDDFKA